MKEYTQALSLLLAASLANAPAQVVHGDLLRTLARKKDKDLEPGTQVHSDECSFWTEPGYCEDPEVELGRFLGAVVGPENVDAALR